MLFFLTILFFLKGYLVISLGCHFFPFIFISWKLVTLQYCSGFFMLL